MLDVCGELDLSTAVTLCAEVEANFREPAARLVIDLSRLQFCDSTGLRALLGVVQEARVHGVHVRIVPPVARAAMRAMEIAGATEFLPLTSSPAEALSALRDGA